VHLIHRVAIFFGIGLVVAALGMWLIGLPGSAGRWLHRHSERLGLPVPRSWGERGPRDWQVRLYGLFFLALGAVMVGLCLTAAAQR